MLAVRFPINRDTTSPQKFGDSRSSFPSSPFVNSAPNAKGIIMNVQPTDLGSPSSSLARALTLIVGRVAPHAPTQIKVAGFWRVCRVRLATPTPYKSGPGPAGSCPVRGGFRRVRDGWRVLRGPAIPPPIQYFKHKAPKTRRHFNPFNPNTENLRPFQCFQL